MRSLVLVVALAGCHGATASGPAWPKSAGTVAADDYQADGGESLAPRPSHVAAIEVAGDDTPAASAPATIKPPVEAGTATTPVQPPVPPTETIEIQIEEIQIGPGGDIIIGP